MSIIDIIRQRQHATRRLIEVPEWAGESEQPMIVYATKLQAMDVDKIQRKYPNFSSNPTMGSMVDVIIMKAEDKDGNKMFTLENKPDLMREDWDVIARISGEIVSATSPEEHEKN